MFQNFREFAAGIATGLFATIGALLCVLASVALFWPERLPAPSLSRVANIDEKLRFLRYNEFDPHVLAVGSSITWRQLDGSVFDKEESRFLNGGLVALKAHQTLEVTRFYLSHYERVREILVLTSTEDFTQCTQESPNLFDPDEASRYVFRGWLETFFYFRNFAPNRFLTGVLTLPARRTPYVGDMYIDAFGSGPAQVPEGVNLGLRYGSADFDAACVDAFIQLSNLTDARGISLTFVFAPIHPDFRAAYPETMEALREVENRIRAETRMHKTNVLMLADDPSYEPKDFYDALHLQWSAVPRLSRQIARSLPGRPTSDHPIASPKSSPNGILISPAAAKDAVDRRDR